MRIGAWVIVSALALAGADRAAAADIPPARPAAAPAVVPLYNWTGFYLGGHAGYGFADGDAAIGLTDAAGILQLAASRGIFPLSYAYDRDGYVAGGQLGYNFQTDRVVLGIEADIAASGMEGSRTIVTNVVGFAFPNTSTVSQDMTWFGTVRGRLGYAANNWLLFATGGLAYGNVKYSYSQTNAPLGAINIRGSQSEVALGWTAGAGIEYGWDRWSAKLEYLYFDLGDRTFSVPHNLAPSALFNPTFSNSGSIVRGGLNYRFN